MSKPWNVCYSFVICLSSLALKVHIEILYMFCYICLYFPFRYCLLFILFYFL